MRDAARCDGGRNNTPDSIRVRVGQGLRRQVRRCMFQYQRVPSVSVQLRHVHELSLVCSQDCRIFKFFCMVIRSCGIDDFSEVSV